MSGVKGFGDEPFYLKDEDVASKKRSRDEQEDETKEVSLEGASQQKQVKLSKDVKPAVRKVA
jgi:hypothetical protein